MYYLTPKSSVCVTSQNIQQCTCTVANGTTVALENESDNYNYETYCHLIFDGKRLNEIKDKDYNRHSSK